MMIGNARDIRFCSYEKYGYDEYDLEEPEYGSVVAECEYVEVESPNMIEMKEHMND